MLKQWEKHPQRFGLVVGFVVVPLLWWLQEVLLRLATSYPLPRSSEVHYFVSNGTLPGAILGLGLSQAYFAHRIGDIKQAKQNLIIHSILVLTAVLLSLTLSISAISLKLGPNLLPVPSWIGVLLHPGLYKNFAVQIASLMLFIGLLMRSRPSKHA